MTHAHNEMEKAAIIAVQSILNAREAAVADKVFRLCQSVGNLPPHRALLVYGYAMTSVARRLSNDNLFKTPLTQMGQTITLQMGNDYAALVESDMTFEQSQKDLLAENLYKIAQLMDTVALREREMGTEENDDDIMQANITTILDAMAGLSWRSADQALGKPVESINAPPANDLLRIPVSPKAKSQIFKGAPLVSMPQKKASRDKQINHDKETV